MIPVRNARLRGAILATAFASSMAVGPAAHAGGGGTFNNVDLQFRGGDATALAVCANFGKTWSTYDEKKKKKLQKKRIAQANSCENKAKAVGGDVEMGDVDVLIYEEGKKKAKNDVSLEITGGDATAIAACLNVLQGTATSVKQENDCDNSATAKGGDVTLGDVSVIIDES
jgi:hypothetical protein